MTVSEQPEFEPTRLTIARQRNRWTKARLAKVVGVSLRMVSQYESGGKSPSPDTLARIARALNFPIEFFSREALEPPPADAASFRSLARRTGLERDAALAAGALAFDFAQWIAARFRVPAPNLPDLHGVEPEVAASVVRGMWSLGQKPIPNAIHLLESRGVRVFSLSEQGTTVDAFSIWHGALPFIFLNTQKSAERSRHDAMHELGHLVLHRHHVPAGHIAEREADAFASAMLMPRESMLNAAVSQPTLDQLIRAKRRWGASLANYVYRMHRLAMLTDWQYHTLFVDLGTRGYRREEPEGILHERSQVLEKVFAHLRQRQVFKHNVAAELAIPLAELEALVFGLVLTASTGKGGSVVTKKPEPNAPRISLAK